MSSALDSLLDLLDLEQIERDIFRGTSRSAVVPRVFGGQVAAQALVAAGRTVPAGLGQARIHTQDGRLAITVIQEGVVRVPRD